MIGRVMQCGWLVPGGLVCGRLVPGRLVCVGGIWSGVVAVGGHMLRWVSLTVMGVGRVSLPARWVGRVITMPIRMAGGIIQHRAMADIIMVVMVLRRIVICRLVIHMFHDGRGGKPQAGHQQQTQHANFPPTAPNSEGYRSGVDRVLMQVPANATVWRQNQRLY